MTGAIHDTTGLGTGPSRESNPADAEAIVQEIQRPNQWAGETITKPDGEEIERTTPTEWRWLPKMKLPGFGTERETCGKDWYVFCECCGDAVRVGQTCRASRCPRCAQDWCRRAATAAASKLKALWAYKMASTSDHQFFHHVVISPPDDWKLSGDPDTVFSRTKDVVKAIMDELGVHGIPIYHPFRGNDEQPGDDQGEWKNRVFEPGRDWDDVSDELEFSPHWHVVGVAPYVDIGVTEEVQDRTGWVIHRITQEDSNVSVGNDWDLARVVSYCLSHCGVYETDSGNSRAAYYPNVIDRYRPGSDAITATDEQKKEMDQIVRSVVPQTLGIDYHSVACGRDVPKGEGGNGVSLSKTMASSSDGAGDGDGSDDSDEQDDDLGPDSPETPADPDETEPCEGRMLGIDKAPEYLNDPEWRREAAKANTLQTTFERFKRKRGVVG